MSHVFTESLERHTFDCLQRKIRMPKKCVYCHETKRSSEFHGREPGCKECKKVARKKRRESLKDAISTLERKFEQSVSERDALQKRMRNLEKQVKSLKILDHTTCEEEISKLQEDVDLIQDVCTRTVEGITKYLDAPNVPSDSASNDSDHKPSALDETIVLKTPALTKNVQNPKSALYEKYAYKPKS